MTSDEIAATALANKNLLVALVDYLAERDPKIRAALRQGFNVASHIAATAEQSAGSDQLVRSVQIVLEMLAPSDGRPPLTLVPNGDQI